MGRIILGTCRTDNVVLIWVRICFSSSGVNLLKTALVKKKARIDNNAYTPGCSLTNRTTLSFSLCTWPTHKLSSTSDISSTSNNNGESVVVVVVSDNKIKITTNSVYFSTSKSNTKRIESGITKSERLKSTNEPN